MPRHHRKFIPSHIPGRIQAWRKAIGMTQAELAGRLDFDSATNIVHIEKGRGNLTIDRIVALCAAFHKTPNDLLIP